MGCNRCFLFRICFIFLENRCTLVHTMRGNASLGVAGLRCWVNGGTPLTSVQPTDGLLGLGKGA